MTQCEVFFRLRKWKKTLQNQFTLILQVFLIRSAVQRYWALALTSPFIRHVRKRCCCLALCGGALDQLKILEKCKFEKVWVFSVLKTLKTFLNRDSETAANALCDSSTIFLKPSAVTKSVFVPVLTLWPFGWRWVLNYDCLMNGEVSGNIIGYHL